MNILVTWFLSELSSQLSSFSSFWLFLAFEFSGHFYDELLDLYNFGEIFGRNNIKPIETLQRTDI